MAPRPIVLGIVEKDGRILVERGPGRGHFTQEGAVYHRPLGGGIEHGEQSRDAMVREFREEIGAEVEVLKHLGVLENVFHVSGHVGHEIVFLYRVAFQDPGLYETEFFPDIDGDPDCVGVWVPLEAFYKEEAHLVPSGLTEILKKEFSA